MTTWRTPVAIAVQPWFGDHCFAGKVVLPAVETMFLLAAGVAESHPAIDIRVMADVHFARFLEIPAGSNTVAAMIEYCQHADGSILAKLLSRRPSKLVTRMQEHGEILFSPFQANRPHFAELVPECLAEPVTMISVAQVYKELVPFGPGYHTLQDTLCLSGQHAWGRLQAPVLCPLAGVGEIIGSPFPLDGAMHAACVLGQRSADFVPFPVGLARRTIIRPTQPGGRYQTRVDLLSLTRDELVCDLQIFDDQGEVYESVSGVRMRDVSGGRIKPPAWIQARSQQ